MQCDIYENTANHSSLLNNDIGRGSLVLFAVQVVSVATLERTAPLLCYNFLRMRHSVKNCSMVNNSNHTATLSVSEIAEIRTNHKRFNDVVFSSTEELIKMYRDEKNAKNQAYYFILKNNLLNDFTNFCNEERRLV